MQNKQWARIRSFSRPQNISNFCGKTKSTTTLKDLSLNRFFNSLSYFLPQRDRQNRSRHKSLRVIVDLILPQKIGIFWGRENGLIHSCPLSSIEQKRRILWRLKQIVIFIYHRLEYHYKYLKNTIHVGQIISHSNS